MLFPESKRRFYGKNTLYRVVLQLRFKTSLQVSGCLKKFKAIVNCICPNYNEKSVLLTSGTKTIHVFSNNDNSRSIELNDEAIAIVFNRYEKWEDFLCFYQKAFECLQKAYGVTSFSRIGLRYIDRFIDTALNTNDWGKMLNAPFIGLLGMDDGCLRGFQTTQEVRLNRQNAKVLITTSALVRKDSCCGVQLDYDCSVNEESSSEDDIRQKLDYLHIQSRNIFESVITDELRKIMEVKE